MGHVFITFPQHVNWTPLTETIAIYHRKNEIKTCMFQNIPIYGAMRQKLRQPQQSGGGLCLYCAHIQPSLQFLVLNLSGTATTTPVEWWLVIRLLRHLAKSPVLIIQQAGVELGLTPG